MGLSRLTVIVPCWGDYERFLPEALDSVPPEATVIVVGSPGLALTRSSGTMELVETKEPHSIARARNLGLSRATTDFVAFLDADDRFHEDALREILQMLERSDDLIAVSGNVVSSSVPGHTWPPKRLANLTTRPFGGPLLLFRNTLASVGACVMRRTAVHSELFFDGLHEDWHASLALVCRGRVKYIDLDVIDYAIRQDSTSRRPHDPATLRATEDRLLATAFDHGARPRLLWRCADKLASPWRARRR